MPMPVWLDETAELICIVLGMYAALGLASRLRPAWSKGFAARRMFWLLLLITGVVLAQVSEEAIGGGSKAFDSAVLLGVHRLMPAWLVKAFGAVTLTGSAKFLFPAVAAAALALWLTHRRFDALQMTGTALIAMLVVYGAKSAFDRARPALWDTQWYWGSSFPSGHTLETAAIATAACLVVGRTWPAHRTRALALAATWVALVGLARLVLGVHWPTDVFAAACAGLLVAIGVEFALGAAWRAAGLTPPPRAEAAHAKTLVGAEEDA
jgi:undecaprenyl-diphosphatase